MLLCGTKTKAEAFEVGYFAPELMPLESMSAGEIGYIALGVKNPQLVKIGDTVIPFDKKDTTEALTGYHEPQPVVFASIYPQGEDDFDMLKNAVEKLHLIKLCFNFTGYSYCGFHILLYTEVDYLSVSVMTQKTLKPLFS